MPAREPRATSYGNDRNALGLLAMMLSEYASPQLRMGLGSLKSENNGLTSCRGRIVLSDKLRLDHQVRNHLFAMPDGTLFHISPVEGQPPKAAFIDPKTGTSRDWQLPFRPFSVFVDQRQNWVWTVQEAPSMLRAYDTEGAETATLPLPATLGGSAMRPRYGVCTGDSILLGFYNGAHGVLRLDAKSGAHSPQVLLQNLPHLERLYWSKGLLLSTHYNPNILMIHSTCRDAQVPLRTISLQGEPLTLAHLGAGCILCTKDELLRLDADFRPCWCIALNQIADEKLYLPSLTEATDDTAWLKSYCSDTIYKIRATLHEEGENS